MRADLLMHREGGGFGSGGYSETRNIMKVSGNPSDLPQPFALQMGTIASGVASAAHAGGEHGHRGQSLEPGSALVALLRACDGAV